MSSISIQTKKINELDQALAVGSDNDLLVLRLADGTGTKAITVGALRKALAGDISQLETEDKASVVAAVNEIVERLASDEESLEPLSYDSAGAHNAIYRGKNLGTAFTAAQSAAIRDGSFKDLYIGDYWTINGTVYRIADFDYFLRSGDTECTAHHAVIVPDVNMDSQKMNDTNVTTGAYIGSKMYTTYMATAKAKIKADFGSAHILAHREYLANAVANGKQSAGAWYDSEIELMTESMVYGAPHFAPACDGSTVPANYTVACKQLNLFRHRPDLISNRRDYWLRDVVSAAGFAYVSDYGYCRYTGASYACGVRPAFPIY